MNTQQMQEVEGILCQLLLQHKETTEAFGNLSAEDKIHFYPRFIESINRTEKLIQDARVKQLPAVAG